MRHLLAGNDDMSDPGGVNSRFIARAKHRMMVSRDVGYFPRLLPGKPLTTNFPYHRGCLTPAKKVDAGT